MSKRVLKQAAQLGREFDEKKEALKEAIEDKARKVDDKLADLAEPNAKKAAKPIAKKAVKPIAKKAVEFLQKHGDLSSDVSDVAQSQAASFLRPAIVRRRRRSESYRLYITRLVKDLDPASGITQSGLAVMDNLTCDLFERLAHASTDLIKVGKRLTLSERDVEAAVKLHLKGELRRECEREARAAVKRFKTYQ